jgi:5-formyltetrahydrofolate cyclo-ligase
VTHTPRSELRKILRTQRQQLTTTESELSAQQLTEKFITSPLFLNSTSIAAYLPHKNEISPVDIMRAAWELKKIVYIPVLHPYKKSHMEFVRWTPDTPLTTNRYGILESQDRLQIAEAEILDLVLVPLIGFDKQGNRLGTGGGYYDRTFEFLQNQKRPAKPILIGLAYDFQCVENLPVESWDVSLDGVLTEKEFYKRCETL